jgi:CP family cyanate transporter-like MFS transporter
MSVSIPERRSKTVNQTIVTIAFVLVCLNLRIVYGGVGPLLPYMQLEPLAMSALTALPPLCMGLFAAIGATFARRFGEERALFLSIAILTIGVLIRSFGVSGLLAGTVVASIGIAALNVLTPVFVRQNFAASQIGVMMGIYAMMMGLGGGLMAALAVPLYHAAGGSWPIALGSAAIPAVVALLALVPLLGSTSKPKTLDRPAQPWHWLLSHPSAWSITGFFGIHCLIFYIALSLLPAIYVDKGATPAEGGIYLALSMIGIAVGRISLPASCCASSVFSAFCWRRPQPAPSGRSFSDRGWARALPFPACSMPSERPTGTTWRSCLAWCKPSAI